MNELEKTRLALKQWERWNSSWIYRRWRSLRWIIESYREKLRRNYNFELWQIYAIIGVWNRKGKQ